MAVKSLQAVCDVTRPPETFALFFVQGNGFYQLRMDETCDEQLAYCPGVEINPTSVGGIRRSFEKGVTAILASDPNAYSSFPPIEKQHVFTLFFVLSNVLESYLYSIVDVCLLDASVAWT